MNAEVRLDKLLRELTPQLQREAFVFCSLNEDQQRELLPHCLCLFREREGVSAILPQQTAEQNGLEYEGVFRQLSLQVHSCLQSVGLTAAVASELAAAGISANVVAALHHDHIFVPEASAQQALQLLRGLSNRAQYT
jgi:hypothetical protein